MLKRLRERPIVVASDKGSNWETMQAFAKCQEDHGFEIHDIMRHRSAAVVCRGSTMLLTFKGPAPDQLPSEQPISADQPTNAPCVIGYGMKIVGDVETNGPLQIEGEVHGEVSAPAVVVGERARVTGTIVADEIVVVGQVMGQIRGKRVVLQASCRVEADIFHETFFMDPDAVFEGRLQRSHRSIADPKPL